jgi:outer membrane protein OmpA-like peptidoglycan-associated protein
MKNSARSISLMIAMTVMLVMSISSGCATRGYARRQVKPVNQRVTDLDQKTSEQIAAITAKEQADVSRLDERISTTDGKVVEVAGMAQQASNTASQAMQLGEANRTEMRTHQTHQVVSSNTTSKFEPTSYTLIDKGDITFKVNKTGLDKQSQSVLNAIAQKARATPGAVINLEGFADKSGGDAHNLTLSRQRADAVARYLVQQNVPLQDIHRIGLGDDNPSSTLASDFPNPGSMATRRVYIRVYAPTGEASRQQR